MEASVRLPTDFELTEYEVVPEETPSCSATLSSGWPLRPPSEDDSEDPYAEDRRSERESLADLRREVESRYMELGQHLRENGEELSA